MKNLQKGFAVPIIIAVIALLTLGGGAYIYTNTKVEAPVGLPEVIDNMPTTTVDNNIVGGDKDEHGCIGSAGYSWCAVKNKCLRVWEEKCENTPINSGPGDKDGLVACTMDALQCPDGSYVGRSGPKCEFVCPKTTDQELIKNISLVPNSRVYAKELITITGSARTVYKLGGQFTIDASYVRDGNKYGVADSIAVCDKNKKGCIDLVDEFVNFKTILDLSKSPVCTVTLNFYDYERIASTKPFYSLPISLYGINDCQ
jgi:hypothetical protein